MLTRSSTECGQLVHTVRNDLTDRVLHASPIYGPDEQNHPSKDPVEPMDIPRFARVHGRHRKSRDLLIREGLPKIEFGDLPLDELGMSTESVARTLDQLERDFLRRYRDARARDNTTPVRFATEYIEARRRQRQHRQDLATSRATSGSRAALDDDPRGLTSQEQEILDALRTMRQREEARR